VTLNLIPNPEHNRFYNIEMADDPKGTRKEKITQLTTIDQFGNATTTTTRQVKTERNLVVSAQAGWSTEDMRLRVGLFDSTGGAGIDYLMNDRVTLTGEAFDFGKKREDNPHLRLYGQYVFRKEKKNSPLMFLSTGVDDVLNDTAFTVGGGIRWRDEDLKYLLGSIPLK
jgi:phospholipid/cholesterol/gamma-HCH transport system substrate-binding protein